LKAQQGKSANRIHKHLNIARKFLGQQLSRLFTSFFAISLGHMNWKNKIDHNSFFKKSSIQ